MKTTVVGTGYVGLVSRACFSDLGIEFTCVEIDQRKVENLKNGIMPICERGLEEIVAISRKSDRLNFTADLEVVSKLLNSKVIRNIRDKKYLNSQGFTYYGVEDR